MAGRLSGNTNSELPRIGTKSPPGISLSPTTTILNNTLIEPELTPETFNETTILNFSLIFIRDVIVYSRRF